MTFVFIKLAGTYNYS